MLVGFRTDASLEIGSGHVMRCLALADGLRESKARVIFFCRPYVGHLIHLIRQRGYDVAVVQVPADTDGMFSASAIQPPWPGTDDWEVDAASTCELIEIGRAHV